MSRPEAIKAPMVRERYAAILLTEEVMGRAAAAAPSDLGVPAAWVPCEVQRALVLHYVAGDGQNLPQAAKVRATLAAWAKGRISFPPRLLLRSCPSS